MDKDFEVLAEWTIRKLRDIDASKAKPESVLRWVLYSLGVKDLGVDIFMYIREHGRATTTEIADKFSISPATARRYLEQLHSLGLVDYIGREYHLAREDISGCIRDVLIPRIRRVLESIARIAETAEKKATPRPEEYIRPLIEEFREIKRSLEDAKRETLEAVDKLFRKGIEITPEVLSKVLGRTFDAIGDLLGKLGDVISRYEGRGITKGLVFVWPPRPPRPPRPSKNMGYVKGISIVETGNRVFYRIYSDYEMDPRAFEEARRSGKKIVVRVYGTLKIPEDVGAEDADVVEAMYVYGTLRAPKDFVEGLGNKLVVYGNVEYI